MAVSLQDLDTIFNYDPVTHTIGQLPTHRPTSFDATGIPSIAESANPGQYTRPGSEQRLPQVLTGGSQTQGRAAPGITALDIPTTAPTVMPTMREPAANPLAIEKMLSPAQEKGGVGRKLYRADMPQITDYTPGAFNEQREAQLNYAQMHPWGSAVSEHPGTWGKIAHGLAQVGNIAGDIVAPRIMSEIPGTQLGNEFQQARQAGLAGEATRQGLEKAQTEASRGRAWTAMHPGEAETAKGQAEFNLKDQEATAAGHQRGSPEYNQIVFGVNPGTPDEQMFKAYVGQAGGDVIKGGQAFTAAKLGMEPGKAPIGQAGVAQSAAQLNQMVTAANMPQARAADFLKAYTPSPNDTPAMQQQKMEAAEKLAQMGANEIDKETNRLNALAARDQAEYQRQFMRQEAEEKEAMTNVNFLDAQGALRSGSLADAKAMGGKSIEKSQPGEEQKARDDWTQFGRWMDNAQEAANTMGAWDNEKDKRLARNVQNTFFRSIDAAPFGVGVHLDSAWINAFQNSKDYKAMSLAGQAHMQNMAQVWSDAINLMKAETNSVPRGEQFLQRESAILPQADKTQAMNRQALKQFTSRIKKDASGKARPINVEPLGDLNMTYSFSVGNKKYTNVPEEVYTQAKSKPGFKEE